MENKWNVVDNSVYKFCEIFARAYRKKFIFATLNRWLINRIQKSVCAFNNSESLLYIQMQGSLKDINSNCCELVDKKTDEERFSKPYSKSKQLQKVKFRHTSSRSCKVQVPSNGVSCTVVTRCAGNGWRDTITVYKAVLCEDFKLLTALWPPFRRTLTAARSECGDDSLDIFDHVYFFGLKIPSPQGRCGFDSRRRHLQSLLIFCFS
jgi:hypothetical protein